MALVGRGLTLCLGRTHDVVVLGAGDRFVRALGKCETTTFAGHCAWQHIGATCVANLVGGGFMVYEGPLAPRVLALRAYSGFAVDGTQCVFCHDWAQWFFGDVVVHHHGSVVAIA